MSVADLEFRLPDDVDAVHDPDGGDVIVSRRGSRTPPQVLSSDAWALLELFREPRTLAGAVLAHCTSTGQDPVTTLEAAFPVLVALTRSELLVRAGTDAAASLVARHAIGERVGPATLVARIRVLRDSELWDGILEDGAPVVVKVVDDPASGPDLFRREATALRRLRGGPVPNLVWSEPRDTGGVLVLSFVDGDPVDLAALDARGSRGDADAISLVLATLDAYAAVHARGVLHGDVHPGNILADEQGHVTLIDFGIADIADAGLGPAPRTGGGEQLDPAAAQALRHGQPVPELDVTAEVYSLAALAFRILTGAAYLDLDLERDDALDAIATRPPRPFADVGRPRWPAVESVLARGLAKDPAARQATVADLRDDLARAARQVPAPTTDAGELTDAEAAALVENSDIDGLAWADADEATAAVRADALQAAAVATGSVDAHDLAILWRARAGHHRAGERLHTEG